MRGYLDAIRQNLGRDRARWGTGARAHYVRTAPSPQATVDLFRSQWSSSLPPPLDTINAGQYPLYSDERLDWALTQLGGLRDMSVLELGPLEGGHSYLLEHAGAASVTSIEGNSRAFLRCLLVKELLQMKRWSVLCGDFVEFLKATDHHYELCVAAGVLYHLLDPVDLIALSAEHADRLYLQTHYYDEAVVSSNARLSRPFRGVASRNTRGYSYEVHPYHYGIARRFAHFCGGPNPTTSWMSKDHILEALEHFGWKSIVVGFDEQVAPNGPWLALTAEKA